MSNADGAARPSRARPPSAAPLVSVVVPTYGRPDELRRAIRTVQLQTLTEWELVIVDDGSPQPVVLAPDVAADERVVLIRHPTNLGVSHARNAGIAAAKAPWIAFLDDDDLWWPGKLSAQLEAAGDQEIGFVFTGRLVVNKVGRVFAVRQPASTDGLTRALLGDNVVGEPSTVMVSRDALSAVGGFDPQLSVVADWDMWLRLSQHAVPIGVAQNATAILIHEGSMQVSQALRIPAELEVMRARHAELLAVEALPFGSPVIELWEAHKRWKGQPSPTTLFAYVRHAQRNKQMRAVAGRKVAAGGRKAAVALGRSESARTMAAPGWVLDQLSAG